MVAWVPSSYEIMIIFCLWLNLSCRHDAQYSRLPYAPHYSTSGVHHLPTPPENYEDNDTSNTQGIIYDINHLIEFTANCMYIFSTAYGRHDMWRIEFPSGWSSAAVPS